VSYAYHAMVYVDAEDSARPAMGALFHLPGAVGWAVNGRQEPADDPPPAS
jgi:hypothetical protein